jgi:S1-C subfamily serine protease
MKFRNDRAFLGIALPLALALSQASLGQIPAAADLSAKILPSVVALSIQMPDGRTTAGTGFLTIKDGILATTWRPVSGAKGLVARFSNGEEFECSGIIDKDEKRNIALIRIKTFGRPLLKMSAAEPATGEAAMVAAVKEGAFGMVPVTAGETTVVDGVRLTALSGDVPEGNNGAPVVNARGEACGVLASREVEGRPAVFALPAASVLALDVTLPTQPWSAAAPAATGPAGGKALMANDEVDARLGQAFLAVTEGEACLSWAGELSRGYGFLSGVPSDLYQAQQALDTATASLGEVRTDDELRLKIGRVLMQILANQKAATENFIRGVVTGQQAKNWVAQADDALKRSNSIRQTVTQQIAGLQADLKAFEAASPKFREFLPVEQRYVLGLAQRSSGYRLGVTTYPRNPFTLLVVAIDGFGYKIGLRPGDVVVSATGRTYTDADDFEEFKLLIKANLGKTLPVVVKRNGKTQTVPLKIPREIPKDALYIP